MDDAIWIMFGVSPVTFPDGGSILIGSAFHFPAMQASCGILVFSQRKHPHGRQSNPARASHESHFFCLGRWSAKRKPLTAHNDIERTNATTWRTKGGYGRDSISFRSFAFLSHIAKCFGLCEQRYCIRLFFLIPCRLQKPGDVHSHLFIRLSPFHRSTRMGSW